MALGEQPPDQVLGVRVVALAEAGMADVAVPIDQVLRRPVLVQYAFQVDVSLSSATG